jgi:hypothetical protein
MTTPDIQTAAPEGTVTVTETDEPLTSGDQPDTVSRGPSGRVVSE